MAAEVGPIVPWELARLEKKGRLEDGENVRDAEEAWTRFSRGRGRVGALVVTDRRLIFVSTGVITRRTRLVSIPLDTVESVEVVESARWGEDRGAIAVDTAGEDAQRHEFERISGGRDRAAELVDAIGEAKQLLTNRS
jgi:Bacterial PH domain